jgi:hypothetical protein
MPRLGRLASTPYRRGNPMNELLSKISSYNLFNYLFPGAAFTVAADSLHFIDLPKLDVATLLLIYYSIGLVISRLGSIVIEPVLRKIKFVRYSDYGRYVTACDTDTKIEVFVEQNNTYRTLLAAVVALLLSYPISYAADRMSLSAEWRHALIVVFILGLFLFSFRKQSEYISKRVDHRCPSPLITE